MILTFYQHFQRDIQAQSKKHPTVGFRYLSHENKTALLSIESWLFNKNPYFMVDKIIPI